MLRVFLLGAAIAIIILPLSARATGCGEWNRMSDAKKWDRIDRMIEDAMSGSGGRSYSVNRNAIERCLQGYSEDMFWDFNDLCSDSSTASMSAIRRSFKKFIWGCVNAGH
jgi:hypothetical protein